MVAAAHEFKDKHATDDWAQVQSRRQHSLVHHYGLAAKNRAAWIVELKRDHQGDSEPAAERS